MQAPFVKHAVAYYDAVSDGGNDNTVTGNTFNHNSEQTHPLVKERGSATGNTITPNTENHI